MDIVQNILKIAEEHTLTNQQLCKLLNTNPNKIYDWKIKKSKPSAEDILILSDYFNISADYLLGRIENVPENQTAKIEVNQTELIENYEKLNEKGKEEALKRVHELTYISQYTDTAAQEKIRPAAIAAYGGKGVEMKPLTKEQLEKTQEALKKIKFRTE